MSRLKTATKFFEKQSETATRKNEHAQALAAAEVAAVAADWTYKWMIVEEDSWGEFLEPEMSLDDVKEIVYVHMLDKNGTVLQSLVGIIDPTKNEERLIEAELAYEHLRELEIL